MGVRIQAEKFLGVGAVANEAEEGSAAGVGKSNNSGVLILGQTGKNRRKARNETVFGNGKGVVHFGWCRRSLHYRITEEISQFESGGVRYRSDESLGDGD